MKDLARRFVPRSLRNALRRPSRTLSLIFEGVSWRLGRRATCDLRGDWTLTCHPAARRAFLAHRDDLELRSELESFVKRCRAEMVLFDVGAHYGLFSLAALRFGGPTARCVAVEPSPQAASVLRANLEIAAAPGRVFEIAAGATDGTIRMLSTGPNAENYMIGTDESRPDVTEVPQKTLSSLARETGLSPTHLKIDVEGFEGEVIEGARDLLERARPVVFLELHGEILRQRGHSPRAVLAALERLGYVRFSRDERVIDPEALAREPLARIVCDPAEAGA